MVCGPMTCCKPIVGACGSPSCGASSGKARTLQAYGACFRP
jgi:hypothetical protein